MTQRAAVAILNCGNINANGTILFYMYTKAQIHDVRETVLMIVSFIFSHLHWSISRTFDCTFE